MEQRTTDRSKVRSGIILLSLAAFLLVIMMNVPYGHDEWRWGLPARAELMRKWFDGYNGRLLGNLLVLAITRSGPCKTLILWTSTMLILWILARISDKKSMALYMCLAVILLMSMPASLYAQSLGWPAAFVNFVPPVLAFFAYYLYISPIFKGKTLQEKPRRLFLLFILGTAGQLFSEHNTIFNFFFAVFVVLYYLFHYKKLFPSGIAFLTGTAAGAIMMFSNSAYRAAVVHSGTYKSISISVLDCWKKFRDEMCAAIFQNNVFLITFLTALLLVLFLLRKKNSFISTLCIGWVLIYDFMIFIRRFTSFSFMDVEEDERTLWAIFSFFFFFCVLYLIRKTDKDALLLWCCIPFICLPLVAADPIGPRCFFASYIFIEAVGLILFRKTAVCAMASGANQILKRTGKTVILFAFLILTFYSLIFVRIGRAEERRRELIKEAVENQADSVVILTLPYSEYIDITEPIKGWENNFKDFYHIPRNMQMEVQETASSAASQ